MPLSWESLLERKKDWESGALCSGGMGELTTSRFKVWVCDAVSSCANLDYVFNGTDWHSATNPFCYVYDESTKGFCPWGMASDLGMDDAFFIEAF